jgi:hypothetical protein
MLHTAPKIITTIKAPGQNTPRAVINKNNSAIATIVPKIFTIGFIVIIFRIKISRS